MTSGETIRLDKWLWTVRVFKTRSQATEACRSGKVKIAENAVKPSHEVRLGEIITVSFPPVKKSFKVTGITRTRVGAKLVTGFMEDLTPEEELLKLKERGNRGFEIRERGLGRPTKRHRREIELLKKYFNP
jgi:ribosome-associated heat shock protein Hsp15